MGPDIDTVLEDPAEVSAKLISTMAALRVETIDSSALKPEQKDAYLALAAKLAGSIGEVIAKDIDLQRWHRTVVKALDDDARLLSYDTNQRGYWQRHNAKFLQALDKLTIGVLLDQFSSLGSTHHALQAVKYGMATDIDFDAQQRMYLSILPRHGIVEDLAKQGIFTHLLGMFIGTTYQLERRGDTLVIASGDLDALDTILNDAATMGYHAVELHGPPDHEEANELAEKIQRMFSNVNPEVGKQQQKSVPGLFGEHGVPYRPIIITLENPQVAESSTEPSQTYRMFGRMASFPITSDAVASLRLHSGNFHRFGTAFDAEVAAQLRQTWSAEIAAERFVDRKNGCYTFFERSAVAPYSKWILLSCQPEVRYTVAFLSPQQDAKPEAMLPEVNAVLAGSLPLEQKVIALDKRLKPAFVRLAQYSSGIPEEIILVS